MSVSACRAAFVFALIASATSLATAQQTSENMESCLKGVTIAGKVRITNACQKSISISMMPINESGDVERRVIKLILKPGESMSMGFGGFGAACAAGYVSDVPVTLENRPLFRAGNYKCVRN